jgi:glycosyltransferase involved in cell wall biosynthesis
MRILHLDAGKEMRGGQWQVLRLIEGLAALGVESTLLAVAEAPLFAAARDKGWRVEPLGLFRALGAAREHDLVHAHDARSHLIALFISGVPLVVSRRVGFSIRSDWKYSRPRRFIAVSEYVESVLVQGGVPPEKISVVYDGVPLLEVSTAAGGVTVLAKGTALVSEAAKLAGVTPRPTVNLERDLRDAGMLLYLSDSEGLGSGALLAMSAGVPVVASKVGGLLEVIRDGENGMLVPNEPAAIAAALRRLLDNPDLSRRMGRAARQTVMDKFTVDQMVRHTMEVYRQVLRAGLEADPT